MRTHQRLEVEILIVYSTNITESVRLAICRAMKNNEKKVKTKKGGKDH